MKGVSFHETDNLDLKTFSFEKDTISSESDIIRNLKDENGRLMKLLQEKDFEINKIKRTSEKQNLLKDNLPEGVASLKIIELSKKVRETNSECESWKTKYYQKEREMKIAINEMQKKGNDVIPITDSSDVSSELKSIKEKLKTSENKVLELLTTNQSLSRELKVAMKVLESELGDSSVDLNRLLANPGQWRGRAQKIVSLKDKIDSLEKQIKDRPPGSRDLGSGATSLGVVTDLRQSSSMYSLSPKTRQNDILAKMQRDKQITNDKLEEDRKRLTDENDKLRSTCEGLKARNKALSDEAKSYKVQIKNMLDKTKNDDELIGSLILQQDRLKNTLQTMMNNQQSIQMTNTYDMNQAASQYRQDHDTVQKLKEIIELKDKEIRSLKGSKEELKQKESCNGDVPNLDFEELKISSMSMESEIAQLRELVRTEELRLESLLQKNLQLAEDNSRLKQNYLQIERELQKVAPNSKLKSKLKEMQLMEPASDTNISKLLSNDVPITKDTIESLQDEILLRVDKIDSLKNAIELLSAAKKEDVKMLSDIIDQTRNQFVDSLKKLKNQYLIKEN